MMMLMLPMVPVSWKGGTYHAGLLYALFYGIGHGARHHSVVSLWGSQKFPFTPKIVNAHHPCVRTHECKPVRTRPSFWDHATDNYVLTGYLLGFPTTLFLSTVQRSGLCDLMYGGGNSPLPGLRATSRNILRSTTKVNEACARPQHVT
jgi:hypothetical protein